MSDITIKHEEILTELDAVISENGPGRTRTALITARGCVRELVAEIGRLKGGTFADAAAYIRDLERNLAEERETRERFDKMLGERAKEVGELQQKIAELSPKEAPEPVIKAVERTLDEHSAWIARPNHEVTKAVALAATIAAWLHYDKNSTEREGAEPEAETKEWWHVEGLTDPPRGYGSLEAALADIPPYVFEGCEQITLRRAITRPKTRRLLFWCNIMPSCGFSVERKDAYTFHLTGSTFKPEADANALSGRLGGRAIPVTIDVPAEG